MFQQEKIAKFLVSINNIDDISKYKKVGVTTFLFALKDYSIGYENTFSVEEINNIDEKKYVLINRLLNNNEINELKTIIPKLKADGIVFEDIGLINLLKDIDIEKIIFMNHFNANSLSINYNLDYVTSVVVSNELTYDEYVKIVNKAKKELVLNVFGYNQVMYSKRRLLSNFNSYFGLKNTYNNIIKDKNSSTSFKIIEQGDESVVLSSKIFDGRRLINLNNVKYYYLNTSYISIDIVLDFINGKTIENSDEGFLDKKTFFKLEEVQR